MAPRSFEDRGKCVVGAIDTAGTVSSTGTTIKTGRAFSESMVF